MGGPVNRSVSGIIVGVVGFALGATAMRYYDNSRAPQQAAARPAPAPAPPPVVVEVPRTANVNLTQEPLWAYGFTEFAKPGDKAQPQAPPPSKPRPNQDLNEQTRSRQVDGSSASYSLVQIRDLHNVIDWFPGDHPPMTDIIKYGPKAMGDEGRGCGSCHLP